MSADRHITAAYQFFALTLRVQNNPGRIEYVTYAHLRTQKKQQNKNKKASDRGATSERSEILDHPDKIMNSRVAPFFWVFELASSLAREHSRGIPAHHSRDRRGALVLHSTTTVDSRRRKILLWYGKKSDSGDRGKISSGQSCRFRKLMRSCGRTGRSDSIPRRPRCSVGRGRW